MLGGLRRALFIVLATLLVVSTAGALAAPVLAATNQDWSTYLHDVQHTSASGETTLSAANAPTLKKRWAYPTGGPIADSPTLVGGVAYVGSWDGYEYALDAKAGTLLWKTYLGVTDVAVCVPAHLGITSTATVQGGVVYVGGGDANWYALDAATGNVLWKVFIGDNSPAGAHYNWASPVIYNGFAYVGVASDCDHPLVQGQLLKVDLGSHIVVATAKFVPDGQVGGGIWTSPAVDPATNTVFVTTGTLNLFSQTMSEAVVSLDGGSLAIKGVWQLPRAQAGSDSDWGNSPTLITDSANRQLVVATNKNGTVYAFDRNNLGTGPVWQTQIALGGDCPTCGDGSVASSAFARGVLYVAGGNTTINGVGYRGAVRALDPANGNVIWAHGADQPIVPAISWVNGVVIDASGPVLEVLDAATGRRLFTYPTPGGGIYSTPSVWNGKVYYGALDGQVYALSLPTTIATIAPDPNCPAGFTCQDIRNPAAGSEVVNADGTWTVTAAGAAIHGTSDQFRLVARSVSGDAQVSAELLAQSTQATQPQAGVMMRQSNDSTSPFYAILEYPNDLTEKLPQPKYLIWYRTGFGANAIEATKVYPAPLPKYLMIQRQGDRFSAAASDDGVNYVLIPGTTQTIVMPDTLLSGVAVDSGATSTTGTAQFAKVSIGRPVTIPLPQPTKTPCPTGWTCGDIGNPGPLGDQTLAGSTWTLQGTGAEIGKSSDQFHFVSQNVTGDGTLSTQVKTQANTSANAKAGLMLRVSTDPGSPFYGVFTTPGKGTQVLWRVVNNLTNRISVTIPGAAPVYLRITRYTDTTVVPAKTWYTTYTSSDGVSWGLVAGSTVALDMAGTLLGGMAADSNAGGITGAVTFVGTSVLAGASRPLSLCQAGWTCADIGSGFPAGGQTMTGGSWTLTAAGNDIWDIYDQFRYIYQGVSGDSTVSSRVVSQTGVGEWAKAGVMIRDGALPNGANYAVLVTPVHGIVVQYRPTPGAPTNQVVLMAGAAPAFVRAARWTDTATGQTYFTGYTSPDGIAWTEIPQSTVILATSPNLLVGVVADSYAPTVGQIGVDNVSVAPGAVMPAAACPSTWTCQDIGAGFPQGKQTLSGGTWTVNAGGGDIWDPTDNFRLFSQALPGDGTVRARVVSQSGAGAWAKSGAMLRATNDPASPYYAALVTPLHGLAVQYRSVAGAATTQILLAGGAPEYLSVSRYSTSGPGAATYFTAYTSADGTSWAAVPGSTVALNMNGTVLAGLAADAYNGGLAQTVFDGVSVTNTATVPPGICPNTWSCADIGGALPIGGQSLSGSSWTVNGGGGDIWDVADQFHYVWQSFPTDGSLSAQLTSQSATNPYAKAGLMLRATSDAGSPYYAILATPVNGVVVQHRDAQGATTAQLGQAGVAPLFLRVTRAGITFSAYTSSDGSTWVLVPGSTIDVPALSGSLLDGLAATSHDTSQVGTATFATVSSGP